MYTADEGICLQIIPLYTSTKNGLTEVSNYIVCTNIRKIIIYANLLPALQNKAVTAIVYILNLILIDALDGNFLRHTIDIVLSRVINPNKPLLNTLRAYRAITIAYDESVPRSAKIDVRGERRQLVGYEDSIYRVWIPLRHKIKRTLYCQFVKSGKLAELLYSERELLEEFNQQFEHNTIEPRGKKLTIPKNFTLKAVNPKTLAEADKSFVNTSTAEDPTAQKDALNTVVLTIEDGSLLELRQDTTTDINNSNNKILSGREPNVPSILNLLVDETLQRGTRNRTKTARAIEGKKQKKARIPRANYIIANILQAAIKALTALINILKELGIVILKTFKELQTLPEVKQQLIATYKEIAIYNRLGTQRLRLYKGISNTKVLRGRQVFDVKRGPNRKYSRFKARQVVRSFS